MVSLELAQVEIKGCCQTAHRPSQEAGPAPPDSAHFLSSGVVVAVAVAVAVAAVVAAVVVRGDNSPSTL